MDNEKVKEQEQEEVAGFKTLAEANKEYAKLEETSDTLLADAQDKINSLETEAAESQQAMAEAVEKLEEADAKIVDLKEANASLSARVEELEGDKKTVEQEAARLVAATGTDPVDTDFDEGSNTITRKEFEAKSQRERHAFIKDGGKVEG